MKNINKFIAFLLILCMLITVCSCAKKDEEESAAADEVVSDNTDDTGSSDENQSDDNKEDNKTPQNNSSNTQKDDTENKNETDTGKTENEDTDEKNDGNQTSPDDNSGDEDVDPYAPESQFDTYVSNTFVPTGNHFALVSTDETTKTFRGVFPVQQNGRLEYCFYFSNCIDSTWAGGEVAYRDMPTESYEILSAAVMTTKNVDAKAVAKRASVTFDKKKSRTVEEGEMFWSDPVLINVAEGEYLVFEWKVKYTFIPCNKVNGVGYGYESTDGGNSFVKVSQGLPMPSMIGAKRDGVKSVAFIGDSITAGEGGGVHNGYVAQISNGLGKAVSVWNLGLGYARANDAVNSPAWLKKAKTADTVAICFGVNDINSGAYQVGTRTAAQVIEDITTIAKNMSDAGCKVIIISTPPYTYADAARIQKWKDVVVGLQKLAKDNKYDYFDFGKCVADPKDNTTPAYGGHPNGEGCKIVADAFLSEYKNGTISFK